ncbi:MAG: hypothetical protein JSU91_00520 [Thermoplasmatales archaeon]|nr:MAG: hypothetical protein JSU91_00520 [Thermoplasmatales archaeon]
MKKIFIIFLIELLVLSSYGACAISENENKTISPSLIYENYDMVIITPRKFSSAIQPLIDHKNSYGIQTTLKTTEEIYSEYHGRDKAEQIKYFIKDALEEWNITYVLLLGGRKGQFPKFYIPGRYVILDDGYTDLPYLSDTYYADIYKQDGEFDDWDSNGDGIFAEWGNDTLDLEPDVYVGRLPCRYTFEVKIVVDKIIEYETTAYGEEWFNKMIVLGGDTNPGIGDPFPNEGEAACEYISDMMVGFDITKLYCSDGTLTGHKELLSEFNKGCGFILYEGHGLQNRIETFNPDAEPVEPFHNKYVPLLRNKGKYPISVFGCCVTAKFDVTILNIFNPNRFGKSDCTPEEIGWRLVRKPKGGSIAHIGATSVVWGYAGDLNENGIPDSVEFGLLEWINMEFFRLYIEEGYEHIGEMHWETMRNYCNSFNVHTNKLDCKHVQQITLIGDPSLKVGGYSSI